MNVFDPNKINMAGNNFVGGRALNGTGTEFGLTRPSDGQSYMSLRSSTPEDVDIAVNDALQAFRTSDWAAMPPRDRMRIMRKWADLVEKDSETLAPVEALGSTRPIQEVINWDIPFTAEGIRFFAEFADKSGGDIAATEAGKLGLVLNEPYGVIGAIAPWNFPLVMASWKVAPALAAGNAVVLKPSELTPLSVIRLAELAVEAGVPPGIFNVVQGDGRVTGNVLCTHPGISKVTFTGSTATGAAIMSACAKSGPKPVTLELGGKSPQIVFRDIKDLDETAAIVARAITGNAGQVCNAGSRLLVDETIAEDFTARVLEIFRSLEPANTWAERCRLSPVISRKQNTMIAAAVRDAVADGAELLCGGDVFDTGGSGTFFAPTILTGLKPDAPVIKQEIFGPVMTVQTFAEEEEALTMANDTDYGLAAGVHTADLSRAMRAIHKLESGNVWVNRYGRSNDFILPTGGYKKSGIGKDLGRQAFEANQRQKTALIEFPI